MRRACMAVTSTALVVLSLCGTAAAAAPPIPWHRCAESSQKGFQCATIHAPLDYGRPRGGEINLALIRHRATDPARRIGTLFYEPGGPGVGGTAFLPAEAYDGFPPAMRARFDIVSWDPRGVGASTAVKCFANQAAGDAFLAGTLTRTVNGFPVGPGQMTTWIDGYRRLGGLCQRRNGRLLKHVSTVDTVRDLDLMRRRAGERMLNFVGTSYGTLVGAVYANLFPGRVRAMALDGDIDPLAWSHPQRAENGGRFLPAGMRFQSDVETAETTDAFLDLCGSTDTAHCAFSAESPEATRQKFTELLARLPVEPTAGQTSYAQALARTISAIYFTHNWKPLASSLQQLWEQGPAAAPPPAGHTDEQELAIACGEVPTPPASAFPEIDAFAQQRSGVVAPFWAWDYEPCSTWPVRSAHRYSGPWDHRAANPVLVIGNTSDPATPLRGAVAMTQALARARLLTMDGYGHTAILNPSACVNRFESRYFVSGALPPKGTTCRQDAVPFGD